MKIVIAEWDDAYSHGGWHERNREVDHVARCVTVGILLYNDKEQVTISQNTSNTSGNVGDTISIPKGCIKRIRYLKIEGEE